LILLHEKTCGVLTVFLGGCCQLHRGWDCGGSYLCGRQHPEWVQRLKPFQWLSCWWFLLKGWHGLAEPLPWSGALLCMQNHSESWAHPHAAPGGGSQSAAYGTG